MTNGIPRTEHPVALDPTRDARVDLTTKGFPAADPPIPLGAVPARGWTLTDLLPPVLVLRETALAHNLALMAAYCRDHRVELAPHGKTTMAPQLWRRQLDAGASWISAASVAQARVMLSAGMRRILIANEVTDAEATRWIAAQLRDPDTEIMCAVDSQRGVELLAGQIAAATRPLPVLVELGYANGRTGCRTIEEALDVARLVRASPRLVLAGATGFEGTICDDRSPACLDRVRDFLDRLAALMVRLRTDGLVQTEDAWVSAGGSAYFDLVVERLRTPSSGAPSDRVLLRSGCYVTHDAGHYDSVSPFAGEEPERRFRSAIEVWGAVLSRPEPDLAIVGFGRRDVPFDRGLPAPFVVRGSAGPVDASGRLVIERLNDQHAYCRVGPELSLEPGDLVGAGVSHPCTAFDKWRVIPVLDDGDRVVDAVATYF